MIDIQNKQDCCGCSACLEICPQKCISMFTDAEGFDYPIVDPENCIKCHLCTKVCPVLNVNPPHFPSRIYAAMNPNSEIRLQSSSGGIFNMLAEDIINQGGIVFGATFDKQWNVIHTSASEVTDLGKFRGSKYVQSSINGQYSAAKQFLKDGKKVLFSGTPCQIAGLKNYLGREYPLLYTVDFICHGVPSPMVWQRYLKETVEKYNIEFINKISFRDKSLDWKRFSFSLQYITNGKEKEKLDVFYQNDYIRGFLHNLYLRPSCYACPSKSGKSNSDITIADFWGVQHVFPEMDDKEGISMVMVNSDKGNAWYQKLNLKSKETDYETIFPYNKSFEHSARCPEEKRKLFFLKLKKQKIAHLIIHLTNVSLSERLKRKIQQILSSIK